MVECQPTTAKMHRSPVCLRLGIEAQNMDPIRPPIPKDEMRMPRPTESRAKTSLAKMGTRVVWNENPVMLNMTATKRADQSSCSPLTYRNPWATNVKTDSPFWASLILVDLINIAAEPLAMYSEATST